MRFGILGPLLARMDGRDVRFDGPRQAKALAALLIEANQVVPIPRLAAVMWDREGPATAVRQVQDAVSGLRRVLAGHGAPRELISTHRGGYRIGLETTELDLFDFEQQVANAEKYFIAGDAAGAVGALRQAIGVWRSDALADIASAAVAARAAQLNGRRMAVHRQCLEIELTLGRHYGIAEELTGLVGAHPFDEGMAELAMLALHRCGRRADALALYRNLRSLFQAELGIEPNPALQQLHQAVLTEAAEPFAVDRPGNIERPVPSASSAASAEPPGRPGAVPAPRQLPRDLADFTGRSSALDYLCRGLTQASRIAAGSPTVAVVTGPGGFGKSALAVHAAHQLAGDYVDGQLHVDLRGTGPNPADPGEILARFLRTLAGDRVAVPADADEAAAVFRSMVADCRLLIVLDDARDAEQVRPLLPAASGCAVLITSRSRLPELDCVRRVDLDGLEDPDARALLTRIADSAGSDHSADDPEALAEIVRSCAGSPLAVRIAGTRLAIERGLSARDLADRLADPARRLDELAIAGRSVRAAFSVEGRELPDGALRLLGLLALWESPAISLAAVAVLAGLPVANCRSVLEILVDLHLVESRRPGRYGLHDLTRLYATELATAVPLEVRRSAIGALVDWYLRTLADAPEKLAWLDLEHCNLVVAVRSAAAWGHLETAWRIVVGMQEHFLLRNHITDWTQTHDLVLAAIPNDDIEARAQILTSRARALIELRDHRGAERCLLEAMKLPGAEGRTATLIALGRVHTALGRVAEAMETLDTAIALVRVTDNAGDEAAALAEKGYALFRAGNQDTAIAAYHEALNLLPEPPTRTTGIILGYLGEALLATGDPDAALDWHDRALAVRTALDDKVLQAESFLAIGDILHATGRTADACHAWTAAVDRYEPLGHPKTAEVRDRLRSVILR